MGRNRLPEGEKCIRVTISIREKNLKHIDEVSNNRSGFINDLIDNHFKILNKISEKNK